MSLEMSRRRLMQAAAGSVAVFSLGSATTTVFAQVASPEASPSASPVESEDILASWVEGPGEDEITITHSQGETVVKKKPEKIVSFDFASIESLEFLGGTLAGVPDMSGGPELQSDAELVGSLFEPDYEAVNAIAPDLIIVAGRSSAVYPELSDIAPTIDITFGGNLVESFEANSHLLGVLVGNEEAVDTAIADYQGRIEALQAAAADAGSAMVLMASGGNISALAPASSRGGRGALIYQTLGMQPPLEDLEAATHGEPISFEFLLEHDPDWLFVIDRDQATGAAENAQPAEELFDNDIVKQTTAYTSGQIVYVDPFDWYIILGASIPSMDRMLTELETAFGV